MEISLIIGGLVNVAPTLAVWIVALILSSVLLKRESNKAIHFLLAGSSIMLVSALLSIPKPAIENYLAHSDLSNSSAAGIISGINLFLGLISLVGIICLFYAIWNKFNVKK